MTDALVALAEERIAKGSESFAGAARLFPDTMREDASLLYAWCRHCDDVIDGQELGRGAVAAPATPRERLAQLEAKTRAALAGAPEGPIFEALARVAHRHGLSERHPLDHLAGFAMDADGRRYETLSDTLEYCYHVAGVVGVMMAVIMGAREEAALHRASDLGIAFQLTNICRDVAEDEARGRVYLPADLLAAAGAAPDRPMQTPDATYHVVSDLLDLADRYYASARYGLRHLPGRAAWAIAAALRIYREIGRVRRAWGPARLAERAFVPAARKRAQALLALASAARSRLPRAAVSREGLYTRPGLQA